MAVIRLLYSLTCNFILAVIFATHNEPSSQFEVVTATAGVLTHTNSHISTHRRPLRSRQISQRFESVVKPMAVSMGDFDNLDSSFLEDQ